jgi:hypothetical protein
MRVGSSIFLIAVGAILKYAVHHHVTGISIQTIGVILMVAGAVGLVISLALIAAADRPTAGRTVATRERVVEPVDDRY